MVFEVFQGEDGQWYWHLKAANGKLVAAGGEGFFSESNARRSVRRFRGVAYRAPIVTRKEQ